MADIFKKGGLQRKILILMLVVGVLPGIVGIAFVYLMGERLLLQSIGPGLLGTVEKAASEVDTILGLRLREAEELGKRNEILDLIRKDNGRYPSKNGNKTLEELEVRWKSSDPALLREVLENDASLILKNRVEKEPDTFCHFTVTDSRGGLIAASHPVPHFSYSKEVWWKEAMEGKPYLGTPHMCPAGRGNYNLFFAVPIMGPEGRVPLGVLKVEFQVAKILAPLKNFRYGKTGHLQIIDSSGLLFAEALGVENASFPRSFLKTLFQEKTGWTISTDEHGAKSAIAFAPVKARDWYVVLTQEMTEIYAPLKTLMWAAAGPGSLTVIFLALIWFNISRKMILTPVSKLSEGAYLIGCGNLTHRLDIKTGDELEKLAHEFNIMADNLSASQEKLKGWNEELKKEVEKRTADLEEANAELSESKEHIEESLQQVMVLNDELETKREELGKRNEELAGANLRLREVDRLKSEFLANMSHELRTPLTAVIGFSELLIDRVMGELNEEQAGCMDNILTSGQHLLKLINDILDLSKIEAGKMELSLETFELRTIIDFVIKTISPLSNKKKLSLSVETAEEMPYMYADPGKIKQLLLNLVSNAIKFTPEGGKVTIGADFRDDQFSLSVTDTGIGIKPEDRERIFQEFQQVEGSTSREYGGTGLGLTLTKKLTEMHGGRIELESEPGKWSKFTVRIPMRGDRISLDRGARRSSKYADIVLKQEDLPKTYNGQQDKPLILVVEDDEKISKLLTMYLDQAGYRVATARDGDEAIKKTFELRPFAITLDVMLPQKDGWEVLQELKGTPETRDIPVIIVSMVENQELGFSIGAMDYLIKPVSREDLIRSIEKYRLGTRLIKGSGKVLVVDDDPRICDFISKVMKTEGYHVETAHGGEEGIRKALEALPDLIILDLMMPVINGFDVINELKKHPIAKDIPIFVLTAKDLGKEEKEVLFSNVERVVQKGEVSKEDLIEEIRKMEIIQPERAGLVDSVTGLFNHRYFVNRVSHEVSRALRYGRELSICLIEINSFGHYNEVNGRLSGDILLKDISRLLCNNRRKADIAIRYREGKFALICPETGKSSTLSVSKKIISSLEESPLSKGETQHPGPITLSIAVGTYPADADGAGDLISKLETGVNRAAGMGGNRVLDIGEVR